MQQMLSSKHIEILNEHKIIKFSKILQNLDPLRRFFLRTSGNVK